MEGRTVLIVMGTDSLHELDPVGSWLWERWGTGEIVQSDEARAMSEEFGIAEERAQHDLSSFIDALVSVGALEVVE
jgi:hypothetical protein